MGESKHTPGPWFISERTHPQNACVEIVAGEDGRDGIATLYFGDEGTMQDEDGVWGDQPIREANARLIAAAPELLEAAREGLISVEADIEEREQACRDAGDALEDDAALKVFQDRRERISFAIAKAEGR